MLGDPREQILVLEIGPILGMLIEHVDANVDDAAGRVSATDPFEVGKVIHHAITTDQPTLRYAVSWGAQELIEGRAAMSDEDWVALGNIADDNDYYDAFADRFGLQISDDK